MEGGTNGEQVPCRLEELYRGSKREMKISRVVLDDGFRLQK